MWQADGQATVWLNFTPPGMRLREQVHFGETGVGDEAWAYPWWGAFCFALRFFCWLVGFSSRAPQRADGDWLGADLRRNSELALRAGLVGAASR